MGRLKSLRDRLFFWEDRRVKRVCLDRPPCPFYGFQLITFNGASSFIDGHRNYCGLTNRIQCGRDFNEVPDWKLCERASRNTERLEGYPLRHVRVFLDELTPEGEAYEGVSLKWWMDQMPRLGKNYVARRRRPAYEPNN